MLRALYEILEAEAKQADRSQQIERSPVPFRLVRGRRTWSDVELRKSLKRAYDEGLIERNTAADEIVLTEAGLREARKMTRNHRLWEFYLIEYADVATSRVDRDADTVEHVLGEEMVARLEMKLEKYSQLGSGLVPDSPHPIHPVD